METITLRVESETLETVDSEAEDADLNRSEYLREVIDLRNEHGIDEDEHDALRRERDELQREVDRLGDRVAELETERDRLVRELSATNKRVDEHKELQRYVDDEMSYRRAGLTTRLKWWLRGKD